MAAGIDSGLPIVIRLTPDMPGISDISCISLAQILMPSSSGSEAFCLTALLQPPGFSFAVRKQLQEWAVDFHGSNR